MVVEGGAVELVDDLDDAVKGVAVHHRHAEHAAREKGGLAREAGSWRGSWLASSRRTASRWSATQPAMPCPIRRRTPSIIPWRSARDTRTASSRRSRS